MLVISRALMTRPRLLVLDKPSHGIMPKLADGIFDAVVAIRQTGMTLLLVEQRRSESLTIADRAFILQTGGVVLSGKSSDVRADPAVRKADLGI